MQRKDGAEGRKEERLTSAIMSTDDYSLVDYMRCRIMCF